jgi:hypothetical protein
VSENTNDIYTLPPGPQTSELIRKFFSNTGLLFPYLHEQTLRETYNQIARDNFTQVRRSWLGLLNMVFAMATIAEPEVGTQAEAHIVASDVFYQRALNLCSKEILRGTTLEVGERSITPNRINKSALT